MKDNIARLIAACFTETIAEVLSVGELPLRPHAYPCMCNVKRCSDAKSTIIDSAPGRARPGEDPARLCRAGKKGGAVQQCLSCAWPSCTRPCRTGPGLSQVGPARPSRTDPSQAELGCAEPGQASKPNCPNLGEIVGKFKCRYL